NATLNIETDRVIRSDRDRLRHLLENLMRNAVEHGESDVTVTVGDLEDGFYIEDDGAGIPIDLRERVFESGVSTADHGTGLGLAITKQVAEAHDWEIRVKNGDEGGARFEITGVEVDAETDSSHG
ncbi:MAG: sensor histidine kinase, partial [Halobacteriota archaeon]